MTDKSSNKQGRQDDANWAGLISALQVSRVPTGSMNLNVDGRQVVGPLQGFGSLWQKTFRLILPASALTSVEVMQIWKENFARFQPAQNRFFPITTIEPGQIVLINASMTMMPLYTGVMVLYTDEESFTLMTSQGHPESGWVTFSTFKEDEGVICQIQTISRANDPLYELSFRLFASRTQDRIWMHVLEALAAYLNDLTSSTSLPEQSKTHDERIGKLSGPTLVSKICLDSRVQWSEAKNIWQNAALRTMFYTLSVPVFWLIDRLKAGRSHRNIV